MITTLLSLTLAFSPGCSAPLAPLAASLSMPSDEFEELNKEYKKERREYRVALREARQAGTEEAFDRPLPLRLFFERFEAHAEAGNAEALLFCALEVQDLGRPSADTRAYKSKAFEQLSTKFVAHPVMETLIIQVGREESWLSEKEITSVLGRIAKDGTGDTIKSEASYQLARRLENQGTEFGNKRAGELYDFVRKSYPETRAAKRCEARIEALKLAPGNEAPDFSAVDPDGNAFKLSDYRGKVVVLDFWGFW